MRAIKSKNTGLEKEFFFLLKKSGLKNFTTHPKGITGSPDIIFKKEKVAVFVDSCYWHGCVKHQRRPSTNKKYWNSKIDNNVKRDKRKRAALRREGWSVLRIWEHDLKSPEPALKRIERSLKTRQSN